MTDNTMPNRSSNQEKAEGDRDTAEQNRGSRGADEAGGITNRPLTEEQENQDEVPERGHTKHEERR